jgi:uncharacterized protein (DUF2141 family)
LLKKLYIIKAWRLKMFRKIFFLCIAFLVVESAFANDIPVIIEINGITINGGSVYVAVYSNENDYKAETAYTKFILDPVDSTITSELELPEGEYVISVFQDKNDDAKLNKTIFGIPTEHVGMTNYSLRGAPGAFNKLKVPVNNDTTKLVVNMGRVKPLGII